MKKTILIVALLFTSLSLFAQAPNWAWAKSAGGTGDENSMRISTDASGNVIVTGAFSSPTIKFGGTTLTNIGYNNIYIVKYDPSGNVLWAKSAGGTGNDAGWGISTDNIGNIFITGTFSSPTITFGSTTLTNSGGGDDIFVVKYDPSGNVLWAKSEGGTNQDVVSEISTDISGNIIVIGAFASTSISFGSTILTNSGSVVTSDIFVVKYDPSGNILWAKSAGGTSNDGGWGISNDASGNIVVNGSFSSSTITFGATTLTNKGDADIFVVKYDPSGNVLWAKSEGGIYDEGLYSSGNSTDAIGNIFITGEFTSPTVSFGSTTLTNSGSLATSDIYIVKYDPSGNVLWAKSAGEKMNDFGYDLSSDASGNVIITGGFASSSITFGATTLTKIGGSLAYYNDFFVVKYDPSGNTLWAKSAGGTGNDFGWAVSTDVIGNILVTGIFDSPTITFGATTLTRSGGSDMFVAKLSSSTGLETFSKNTAMLISPNPFNNSTLIQLPESVQNADIIVSDLLGKKILSKKFSGKEYLLEKGSMSPGVYFVHISDAQHQYPVTKIVVQ
jgi:hypothetical protein